MDVEITIRYSTDNPDEVNESIAIVLGNTLPYMADNVSIHFDTQE